MTDYEKMTDEEIYQAGYDRGYSVASLMNLPEIGETIPGHLDWEGVGKIESKAEALQAFEMLCTESEKIDRQFSPFELTASSINKREDSAYVWDVFDEGIINAIQDYAEKVSAYYDEG